MVDSRIAVTDVDWTKRVEVKRSAQAQRRVFNYIKKLKSLDIELDTLVLPDHINNLLDDGDFEGTNLKKGRPLPQNYCLVRVQGLPLPLAKTKRKFRNKKQLRK
jgi:hypothetical protein